MLSKALFLDRDGVVNHDLGYVHKSSDIVFIDDIFKLTKMAQDLNYLIIVITNQSGIARGKYTEDEFLKLSSWIKERFFANGVNLTLSLIHI